MERATSQQALGSQVSVPTSAGGIALVAANPSRRRVVIKNDDTANPIYVQSGTPTTSHFKIAAAASMSFYTKAALSAISTGGTVVVSVWEEYD